MKVLFDNNVPRSLRSMLYGHEVTTAPQMGWQRLKNGDLLIAAETEGFDVFVTGDKNLAYQQNLKDRKIAIVVLPTIHRKTLLENPALIQAAIDGATPRSFEALPL